MVSPYSAIEKDTYGHISLVLLIGSAFLLLNNVSNLAFIITSAVGIALLFLYYQRIRKLPINVRTPVSDVFIALGGIISTLYIIHQIPYIPLPSLFSSFNPWLALGMLSFGIMSKLFLLEELFKELFRVVNGIKNTFVSWSLRSKKNKLRVSLVALGLALYLSRYAIGEGVVRDIFTTTSLLMFSCILLLDINEIDQFRSSRKFGTTLSSIITFSGIFQFSSDYQDVGRNFLASSLLVMSIDRNKLGNFIKNIYRSFQVFLINLSHSILGIFKVGVQRVRDNYIIVSRGVSVFLGIIFIYSPSSSEITIASSSITTLDFIGGILIFIAIISTVVKILKDLSILIYLSIKHYGVILFFQISAIVSSISYWFIRNNRTIARFVTTSFSFIVIFIGPKIYFLNYIFGFSLLSFIYWPQIINTFNWFSRQFHKLVSYFISDYSRTIGNFGIFSIFATISLKDKNPTLVIFMFILTTISLSIGWDFAIFRFLDRIVSWFVYIIEGSKRFFISIFTILYHGVTLGRAVSLISWMVFILALLNYSTLNRWILFVIWLILWHAAYSYRVKRLGKFARNTANYFTTFVKNVILVINNFLRNLIIILWKFLKNAVVIIYSHTFVLIFWTIGLFFLVVSIILILPMSFELTRFIFGNVSNDILISFIIGVTLFSSAILSIQQTYVRKDKLLIGVV